MALETNTCDYNEHSSCANGFTDLAEGFFPVMLRAFFTNGSLGGERNLVGWLLVQSCSVLQCKDSVRIEEKSPFALEKTSRLIIFREKVGVYCENHTKRISKRCGKMQILVVLQLVVRTDNLHGV